MDCSDFRHRGSWWCSFCVCQKPCMPTTACQELSFFSVSTKLLTCNETHLMLNRILNSVWTCAPPFFSWHKQKLSHTDGLFRRGSTIWNILSEKPLALMSINLIVSSLVFYGLLLWFWPTILQRFLSWVQVIFLVSLWGNMSCWAQNSTISRTAIRWSGFLSLNEWPMECWFIWFNTLLWPADWLTLLLWNLWVKQSAACLAGVFHMPDTDASSQQTSLLLKSFSNSRKRKKELFFRTLDTTEQAEQARG